MNRAGTAARERFLAALVVAVAGSAPVAHVAPELDGAEAEAFLEAEETERRQRRERGES